MEEFPDELVAKHTHKELKSMAMNLGINTVDLSTNAQLAEAIIEARKTKPEATMPKTKPEATMPKTKPEATMPKTKPEVTTPKTKPEVTTPKTKPEVQKSVASMRQEIDLKVKEDQKAAAKMRSDIDELSRSMQENSLAVQRRVGEFRGDLKNYVKEFYYG